MIQISRRRFLAAAGASAVGLALPGCSRSDETALDALARKLRGTLVRPGEPGFGDLSIPRNLRFSATIPQAVALCEDAQDIAEAVKWARDTGTPFAIRGGGHNYTLGSTSSGIIISTRRLVGANVRAGVLQMRAGTLNRDLAPVLADGGRGEWLLPGGNCPNVGVTGATLGGGIGPNAPWAGLAADRLTSATMVTARGDVVTASATENADLFWALRGGAGGNFGVVTDLQYALVPIPAQRATTVRLRFSGIDTTLAATKAWQQVRGNAPRAVCGTFSLFPSDDGVGVSMRAQVIASESGTRDLLAPLLALSPSYTEIVERAWWDVYGWYITPVSPNYSFWDRSLYADQDLPDIAIARLVDVLRRFPPGNDEREGSVGLFGWVGGAVSDRAPEATAYVHRAARTLIETSIGWDTTVMPAGVVEPVPPDLRAWYESLWETILPFSNGRSYQNFPDPELRDFARAYYGGNLERLRAVKSLWDPDNVFTYAQGIQPLGKQGALRLVPRATGVAATGPDSRGHPAALVQPFGRPAARRYG